MKITRPLILILGIILLINWTVKAQTSTTSVSLNNSPIEGQFQYVYEKSFDYEEYKMVKRWYLTHLKSHVLDTLNMKQNQIIKARNQIALRNDRIDSLMTIINETNVKLDNAIKEKDSFTLLGIPMQKAGYNSLVWSVIAVLTSALLLFILLYKRSFHVISQTKSDLDEIRLEFEAFRKRALEREEGIVRKYHNELMKYKSKVDKV